MSLVAVTSSVGATGQWLDFVDGAEEELLRGEFEQKGAELLQQRAISSDVSIPVPRVPDGLRRVGHGACKVTALAAEAAPFIGRYFLQGISSQIDAGHPGGIEIPVDICPDLQKHPGEQAQVPGCPGHINARLAERPQVVSAEESEREERVLEHLRDALSYMVVQKEGTDLSRSTWKIPVALLSEADDSREQPFERIHPP